ncbi:hypothetical protein FOA52_011138 [Chlamydomonas sp. UWO 241]|nr:hypothetical protein FOA52_011138 [Chlamydomonas sp. UWO 241]
MVFECPAYEEARLDAIEEPEWGHNEEGSEAGEPAVDLLGGRFVLDGKVVPLPVRREDPLGVKVESLRMYLDDALGTDVFMKVYRRLESLTVDDDEAEVSREFLSLLGAERLPYLALIHQLIVCEEQWEAGGVRPRSG